MGGGSEEKKTCERVQLSKLACKMYVGNKSSVKLLKSGILSHFCFSCLRIWVSKKSSSYL